MTESDDQRVARLRERICTESAAHAPPDDLWAAVRARIGGAKVLVLPAAEAAIRARRRTRMRNSLAWIGAAAAAAYALFLLGRRSALPAPPDASQPRTIAAAATAPDSAAMYEEQARILFNRLSLERALVRPEALAAIDRDLHVVDSAIAELDAAVAHDPNNPVLHRLLASSYREKVDILKRVTNAE
jgi:hypothetical protein